MLTECVTDLDSPTNPIACAVNGQIKGDKFGHLLSTLYCRKFTPSIIELRTRMSYKVKEISVHGSPNCETNYISTQ